MAFLCGENPRVLQVPFHGNFYFTLNGIRYIMALVEMYIIYLALAEGHNHEKDS